MAGPSAALLFDLDGTMLSTEALHFEAFVELLGRHGRQLTHEEFDTRILGRANEAIFADYFPERDASERRRMYEAKEARVRDRLATQRDIQPTAGLMNLLDWADGKGVPYAVVTNAPPDNACAMLARIGLIDRIPHVVSGEALPHGKPHPLPYLEGLRLTAARAEHSVAFEDSPAGMTAAVAAGLLPVGIAGTDAAADALRRCGARHIARDFCDTTLLQAVAARLGVA